MGRPTLEEQVAQLDHNLTNHPPSPASIVAIEALRAEAKTLGEAILVACPDSRERSLAITNLEQTVMWAVASIARAPQEAPTS